MTTKYEHLPVKIIISQGSLLRKSNEETLEGLLRFPSHAKRNFAISSSKQRNASLLLIKNDGNWLHFKGNGNK